MSKFDDQTLSHLGRCHIDRGALKFFKRLGCDDMLDVGCGTGQMFFEAYQEDVDWWGIDLDLETAKRIQLTNRFEWWDLEDKPFVHRCRFDLIWSVEVAEHIKNEQNFIDTIRHNLGKFAVVTWNSGCGGWHQNPKVRESFIHVFKQAGMIAREDVYRELLEHSTMERSFIKDNGMVFSRGEK